MAAITKDMLIGDVLRADIKLAPIMMKAGLHCLGCPASQVESLEEAGAVHGIDVDKLVGELNAHYAG